MKKAESVKSVRASSAASACRNIGKAGKYISIESGAIAVRNPKLKIRPLWPEVGARASISQSNYHLGLHVDSSEKAASYASAVSKSANFGRLAFRCARRQFALWGANAAHRHFNVEVLLV